MITLLEVCQRVADALECRVPGTITTGGTDTVRCAVYPFLTARVAASDRRFEGTELYMTSGTAAPNPTSIAHYTAATGEFDISPNFATPAAVGNTFDIYLRSVGITLLKDATNRALRQMRYQSMTPLTLIPDGDMEAADTTSWTVLGTATRQKVPATQNTRGQQALRVTSVAALDRVRSQSLAVDASHAGHWYAQVRVSAPTGAARFSAYDGTNSAIIRSVDWQAPGWGIVELDFTVPATCRTLWFELGGVGAGAVTEWDDAIAYDPGATEMPLPIWITDPAQVRGVYRTQVGNSRYNAPWGWEHRAWTVVPDESNPTTSWRLASYMSNSGPLWIQAPRPFPPLVDDADTTFAEPDWVCLAAEVEVLKRLAARAAGQEVTPWKERLYGAAGRPGRLTELKIMNSRLMPKSSYMTVPA